MLLEWVWRSGSERKGDPKVGFYFSWRITMGWLVFCWAHPCFPSPLAMRRSWKHCPWDSAEVWELLGGLCRASLVFVADPLVLEQP